MNAVDARQNSVDVVYLIFIKQTKECYSLHLATPSARWSIDEQTLLEERIYKIQFSSSKITDENLK